MDCGYKYDRDERKTEEGDSEEKQRRKTEREGEYRKTLNYRKADIGYLSGVSIELHCQKY
jgi:hypothetical protein